MRVPLNTTIFLKFGHDGLATVRRRAGDVAVPQLNESGRILKCAFEPCLRHADASFTNLFGMVMYGATAFAKRPTEILATFYKGTTKHHEIRRIRFVTPDVAIVNIDNQVRGVKAMPGGIVVPSDGMVKTQLMEVFVRRDGRWWIEAYHNVEVKAQK